MRSHFTSLLSLLSVFVFTFSCTATVSAQDDDFHLDEVYKIDSRGTLTLSSDDADVFIIGSDRSDVHVKIDRVIETKGLGWGEKHFDIEIDEENGDLSIKERKWNNRTGFIGYVREEYVIRIEAPATVSLKIIGDDDDYEIMDVRGEIDMNVDDGDIRIENCLSTNYRLDVDDSDIRVFGATGKFTATLDDGDLRIQDGELTALDIRGDDSDFDIETTLSDNGNYKFRVEDSDLDLFIISGGGSFEIRHDDGHISTDDGFRLKEEEEHYSQFTLRGGTANVQISGDDLSVRLKTSDINN